MFPKYVDVFGMIVGNHRPAWGNNSIHGIEKSIQSLQERRTNLYKGLGVWKGRADPTISIHAKGR